MENSMLSEGLSPRCPGCETAVDLNGRSMNFAGEHWHGECFETMIKTSVAHFVRHVFHSSNPRRKERTRAFIENVSKQLTHQMYQERCCICGCTADYACGEGCSWVGACICSACMGVKLPSVEDLRVHESEARLIEEGLS